MTLEDFEVFVAELVLEDGRRMVLEPFQRQMLTDYFEGVRESVIVVPKKNGKSSITAALAVFHLVVTPDAECVIAAASRDQATILYDAARGFVRRTPALADLVIVRRGTRELRAAHGDGRIRVLASDADTADGVLPTLAIVDELHRHRDDGALMGVFRDGLGPRRGRMLTISTAGDDEESALGRLRSRAYALPGMTRDGAHRYVRTEGFAFHEWALDPDQDRGDLKLVKTANPASWITLEELRARRESPSMQPWQWARFACGVWMHGEDAAISGKEWAACAHDGLEIPAGSADVHVGLDLGWRWDTTAIVPVWKPGPSAPFTVGRPVILTPPRDGTAIDVEDVLAVLMGMADRWPRLTFVLDPNAGGEQLAQRLDGELPTCRVATVSQRPGPMALAAQRLTEAISAGNLRHPDHEALNRHVLAAAAAPVGEGFRFVKQRRRKAPIDAVIALAMAVSVITGEEQRPTGRASWR